MIAKLSKPGTSFFGVIKYNEKDMSKKSKQLDSENPIHSERLMVQNFSDFKTLYSGSKSLADSLDEWSKKSSRIKQPTFHAALSFAYADKVDNEKLGIIAKEFMQKMGYGDNPFIVYRHYDRKHQHIHIVSSRVGADGKKIDDRFEGLKARNICREFELKYNLTPVSNYKVSESKYFYAINEEIRDKTTLKNAVKNNIGALLETGKYNNFGELAAAAKRFNLGMEIVSVDKNGNDLEKKGIIFYRDSDNQNGRLTHYIKGSEIGKNYYERLVNSLDKTKSLDQNAHKSNEKFDQKRLSDFVSSITKLENVSLEYLNKVCVQHGYAPQYASNSGGIYGVSFEDMTTGEVKKGSEMHKLLSINVLKNRVEDDVFIKAKETAKSIAPLSGRNDPTADQGSEQSNDQKEVDDLFEQKNVSKNSDDDQFSLIKGKRKRRR